MQPALPVIPGNGVGGVVVAVGDGVAPELVGSRVVAGTGGAGAYAEQVAVQAGGLVTVPQGLGMAEAVALLADGRTAALLVREANLQGGETVLVEAAGGGVGSLLVQLARNAGALVVAAAGGERKLDLARRLGAEMTVNYSVGGWTDQVRAEFANGVDVAFDGVGGAVGIEAFALVRGGGRFVTFGRASGSFTAIAPEDAARRQVSVLRLPSPTPAEARGLTAALLADAAAGRIRPVVGQIFSLADAALAHAAIEARSTLGKTLLAVRSDAPVSRLKGSPAVRARQEASAAWGAAAPGRLDSQKKGYR
jgi:NADPH2:quinone reductase